MYRGRLQRQLLMVLRLEVAPLTRVVRLGLRVGAVWRRSEATLRTCGVPYVLSWLSECSQPSWLCLSCPLHLLIYAMPKSRAVSAAEVMARAAAPKRLFPPNTAATLRSRGRRWRHFGSCGDFSARTTVRS